MELELAKLRAREKAVKKIGENLALREGTLNKLEADLADCNDKLKNASNLIAEKAEQALQLKSMNSDLSKHNDDFRAALEAERSARQKSTSELEPRRVNGNCLP